MSLQSKYRFERDGMSVVENNEYYFAYRVVEDEFQVHEVYIREDLRGDSKKYYNEILNFISDVQGIKYIVGYIIPNVIGSEVSMKSLLNFNFKIHSAENNKITLIREVI